MRKRERENEREREKERKRVLASSFKVVKSQPGFIYAFLLTLVMALTYL